MIPSDFKDELDRIAKLFAKIERELNEDITIKADFHWETPSLEFHMCFRKLAGRFRIFYGTKPISDLTAVEKIDVAERIYEFKDAYIAYLSELRNRAAKAGRKDA